MPLVFVLVLATCTALILFVSYRAFHYRRLSRSIWQMRIHVAEIESKLVSSAPNSNAEVFMEALSLSIQNEDHMRALHLRIMEDREEPSGNLDKELTKEFGKYSPLVKEAIEKAANAIVLLGNNPLLHCRVSDAELKKEKAGLFTLIRNEIQQLADAGPKSVNKLTSALTA